MRLLITGVSGLVGSNLARIVRALGHDVVGTYGSHPVSDAMQLDLTGACDAFVRDVAPEAVVHTAAMSKPDECARDPALCKTVNVDASRLLARTAQAIGARFLYLSSDLVYGAQSGEVAEDQTAPKAFGVYATSKLDGERAVLEETGGRAFVGRTSLVYGWGAGASMCFFEEWLAALRAGQPIRVFTDQYRCPTFVDDLCLALLEAASLGLSGVYNVAGPRLCNRHEYALWLAAEFGLDTNLIRPIRMADFSYADPRPLHLELSIAKLKAAMPYRPVEPVEGLRRLHEAQPASLG